jgi:hypothetical protein
MLEITLDVGGTGTDMFILHTAETLWPLNHAS